MTVEIICPYCGGRMNIEDSQTGLVACGYCGYQFLPEERKAQNTADYNGQFYQSRPGQNQPYENRTGQNSFYQGQQVMVRTEPESGRGNFGRVLAVIGGCTAIILAYVLLFFLYSDSRKAAKTPSAYGSLNPDQSDEVEMQLPEAESAPEMSELFEAMTEAMFEGGMVSEADLGRVKYLRLVPSAEGEMIWYSFDDPYGETPDIRSMVISGGLEWDDRDVKYFYGLIRLETEHGLPNGMDLTAMSDLRGISLSGVEFSELAEMVADAGQITDLELRRISSMDGIAAFTGLERLSIEDMPARDLKQLVGLKQLKQLVLRDTISSDSLIHDAEEIRVEDYSALSMMTGLESLTLTSDLIKDLGFLENLKDLKELELEDTIVISLEPLQELEGLRRLCLVDNNKVQDFSPVSRLTGLTELYIDKMTSQPDPDLSGLGSLESLEISGFMSVSGLSGLTGIRELSIHDCNVDGVKALSTLSGVERLTFYSVWNSDYKIKNMDFLEGMPNLKVADFYGNLDGSGWSGYQYLLEVYGDVSAVFNHPGLEELYVHNGMFEIDFNRIQENPTLRVLGMNNMDLHENFYVEGYDGFYNIWYDDVKLNEHMDFLENFPNLEELYLAGNELTDLEFTVSLPKLSRLYVSDNYITDLSPLTRAENLIYLDIRENPAKDPGWSDRDLEIVR